MNINETLSKELNVSLKQIDDTVKLIDEGNTIPFIARYRKEVTGGLDDTVLRKLNDRLEYLRNLEAKKEDVIRIITEQGKMTDELLKAITAASTQSEIEDIYRPYRPKRRTRATIAKEKGLEPLADIIMSQLVTDGTIEEIAEPYVNPEKEVMTVQDAIDGAKDIIAENISDNADYRKMIREYTYDTGIVESKQAKDEDSVYSAYYEFNQPVKTIANHRVLAIDRGEKEGFLGVKISVDEEVIKLRLCKEVLANPETVTSPAVREAAADAYERLISPSIEREIRNILTDTAQEGAIDVFSKNLRQLLLQPPIKDRTVLGFDPGYRTGCKVAVIDCTGKVLDTGIAYCTLPNHDKDKAKAFLLGLIKKHNVSLIAVGNGTASKESEIFIADIIKEAPHEVKYMMVSEAGASVYSASELGAKEFPNYDVALRSAVSIARRLEDPLAELVKIDPKSIGVGQYQHDMNQKNLGNALSGVVEDCVNSVGVDINTASAQLLSYVAGIGPALAKNIVEYRDSEGAFRDRKELKKVKKLGDKAFLQCAGFVRIPESENILDNSAVHPESYSVAEDILAACGYTLDDVKNGNIKELGKKAKNAKLSEIAAKHNIGMPTINDIIDELLKPGRDPRDELPKPNLRSDILSIESLRPGMVLTGTVRNITDFGAFVDIGVHQDGLVHISQICDKFIRHPIDFLSVGDVRKVKIVDIDVKKGRISLSMRNIDGDMCKMDN